MQECDVCLCLRAYFNKMVLKLGAYTYIENNTYKWVTILLCLQSGADEKREKKTIYRRAVCVAYIINTEVVIYI